MSEEKKIIYVVTQGEYSDYGIVGVYDENNKEIAEKCAELCGGQVEEFNLNPNKVGIDKGWKPFFVRMKKNGDVDDCYEDSIWIYNKSYDFDIDGNLYNNVFARDEEHAIKITGELRRKLLVKNEW